MSNDVFKTPEIYRLGELTRGEKATIRKLHKQGKPPGYIFGWVYAGRRQGKKEKANAEKMEAEG